MPIVYAPPVIIHNSGQSDSSKVEIAICQALPTKAETLVCLQKLKAEEDFAGAVLGGILGFIVLAFIIGMLWTWWND